jgi:hypothetical protein
MMVSHRIERSPGVTTKVSYLLSAAFYVCIFICIIQNVLKLFRGKYNFIFIGLDKMSFNLFVLGHLKESDVISIKIVLFLFWKT